MADPRKTGRGFERLVELLERMSANGTRVEFNPRIPDRVTRHDRQVDIAVWVPSDHGELLVQIECKDWGHSLDVTDIKQLIVKRNDIRANRLIVDARKGFSTDTIAKAQHENVILLKLNERGEAEWPDWFVARDITFAEGRAEVVRIDFSFAGDAPVEQFAGPGITAATPLFVVEDGVLSTLQVVNIWLRTDQGQQVMQTATQERHEVTVPITFQNEVRVVSHPGLEAIAGRGLIGVVTTLSIFQRVQQIPLRPYAYTNSVGDLEVRPVMITDPVDLLGDRRRIAFGSVPDPSGGSRIVMGLNAAE